MVLLLQLVLYPWPGFATKTKTAHINKAVSSIFIKVYEHSRVLPVLTNIPVLFCFCHFEFALLIDGWLPSNHFPL